METLLMIIFFILAGLVVVGAIVLCSVSAEIRHLNSSLNDRNRRIRNLRRELSTNVARLTTVNKRLVDLEKYLEQIAKELHPNTSHLRLDNQGNLMEQE
jgi:Tfp pilus assembly protein PilO